MSAKDISELGDGGGLLKSLGDLHNYLYAYRYIYYPVSKRSVCFGHLLKWFVLILMFKFWSGCRLWNNRPSIGYNGWQICDGRAFTTELNAKHKTFS